MRAWLRAPRLPFVRCHLQVEAVVDVDAVLLGHRVRDEDSERLQQRQLLLLGLGPGLAILELLDEAVEELAAEDRLEGDRAVEHVPELRHLRPEGQVLSQGRDLERHVLRAAPISKQGSTTGNFHARLVGAVVVCNPPPRLRLGVARAAGHTVHRP